MAHRISLPGRLFDASVALAIRLWLGTVRVHLNAEDFSLDPRRGATGYIYCIWHENLLFLGRLFADCGMHVLISRSRDGERIARVVEHLGYRPIRGSTQRGGASAALGVLHLAPDARLAITTDGPRGPRRRFQDGAAFLASRTGMPLVAVGVGYHRAWRARSWDQMAFPRPFSRAVVCASRAIPVPADADADTLSAYRERAESAMGEMTGRAENLVQQWAASGIRLMRAEVDGEAGLGQRREAA